MSTKPKPPAPSRSLAKPKTMSSKLLTMKFMQRSASTRTDTLAVREALVQESAKRDAALQARERTSTTPGDAETRWELSYVKKIDGQRGSGVVDWGYGEVVSTQEEEEEEEEEGVKSGRMVFGKFRSKAEPPKVKEEDEEDEEDTPRKKNVSLRGLTSISNAGPPSDSMVCNECGEKGHTQAKCPRAKCYACDGMGHMSRDCPKPRKGKKRQPMGYSGARDDAKKRRSGGF